MKVIHSVTHHSTGGETSKRQPWSRMRRKGKVLMMMTRRARKRRQRRMTAMKTLRWRRPGEEGETETESGNSSDSSTSYQKMMNPMTTPANTVAFPTIRAGATLFCKNIFIFSQSEVLLLTLHFRSHQILLCDSCDSGYHTACCGLRS